MTRWKDTLPSASPSLVSAAHSLVLAIYAGKGWGRNTTKAAAHIRAYRKSLGVKSHRCDYQVASFTSGTDEELLWRALTAVTWAARHKTGYEAAMWCCRWAEADLRELWKRGQS